MMIYNLRKVLAAIGSWLFVEALICYQPAFSQVGANDPTFNPTDLGFGINEGSNISANNINFQGSLVLPDGKIILIGQFTSYNGVPRNRIARLNQDGSLDLTFNPGLGFNSSTFLALLQPDGKIIVGGGFTTFNGVTRNRIARLNSDGSLDNSFDPGIGPDNSVNAIKLQTDGKIVIGGFFTQYQGTTANRITRLNSNGSLDLTFVNGLGANNTVSDIELQSDAKIVIVGAFTTVTGVARSGIARLNTDGTLDASFAIGSGYTPNLGDDISIQPDGKIVLTGNFSSYNGTPRNRVARINTDGSLDGTFDPGTGADNQILSSKLQADGKIVIAGGFTQYNGVARTRIARLNTDGTLDTSFDPGSGANNFVVSITLQADGKVIAEGLFNEFNNSPRNSMLRLDANGSVDTSFGTTALYGANGAIQPLIFQPDGKIIIGGAFVSFNGVKRVRIARLNPDGTPDLSFDSNQGATSVGTGAAPSVIGLALQPDGKIIIGGSFTFYNGIARNRIARLNTDGSLDTAFDPGTGADNVINSTVIQPDGKIVIGGNFTLYNGTARARIARINSDGSLDNTFNPGSGANSQIERVILQPDGKIVIAGLFTFYNGIARNRIARLNTDGSLDAAFDPGSGANNIVQSMILQPDGKIIIGGNFVTYNGIARARIARLNSDGTLDGSFTIGTGLNGTLNSIEFQADGKILIGGNFSTYNGVTVNRLARLAVDGTLDLGFDSSIGADNSINGISLQSPGRAIIAGNFNSYNGVGRNRIARIFLTGGTATTADSLALVSLYNSLGGASWTNKTNWLTGSIRTWYGVKIKNGRVNSLRLNDNGLSGTIPAAVGDLVGLDSLYLNGNRITGTIPSAIGNLSELRFIDLGGNQLTGNVPVELFGLVELRTLGLARNRLTGTIPSVIGQLTRLENFWIDSNQFSGALPTELGTLIALRIFFAQSNQFTSTPVLTGLSLQSGSLSNNRLTFDSILPNVGISNFIFSVQEPVFDETLRVQVGQPLQIGRDVGGGPLTRYAWSKNFQILPGDTLTLLQRAAAQVTDAGSYDVDATHPAALNVNVRGHIRVEIESNLISEESGYTFLRKLNEGQVTPYVDKIGVDGAGNIFTISAGQEMLQQLSKFTASGTLEWTVNLGVFSILNLRVDPNGNAYLISSDRNNILKYSPSGTLLFERSFDRLQFEPLAFDLISNDELVLVDAIRPNLKKISSLGVPIGDISITGLPPEFFVFGDANVDASGNVVVYDYINKRFFRISPTGVVLTEFPLPTELSNQFVYFQLDNSDNLLMLDFNGRVARINPLGQFESFFGDIGFPVFTYGYFANSQIYVSTPTRTLVLSNAGNLLQEITFGDMPDGDGEFLNPAAIALDSKGNRYIVDQGNARVQKFTAGGVFVSAFGTRGVGVGQFRSPQGITVDDQDNVYVADYASNKVVKFNSAGVYVTEFGSTGSGDGQFSNPVNIVAVGNKVAVSDYGNNRVQIFETNGGFVSKFGGPGPGPTNLNEPLGIAVDRERNLLVSDRVSGVNERRIKKFDLNGTFIETVAPDLSFNRILETDRESNLYLAGTNVSTNFLKFDSRGALLTRIGNQNLGLPPFLDGDISVFSGLDVNPAGDTLWVSDSYNGRISIFIAKPKQLSATDSTALVDLYNSTQGCSWTSRTNWLTGPVATWQGVTITGGKVRNINLAGNNLDGSLPPTLASLDNLVSLNLSNNKISGATPVGWNQVLALRTVDLSSNALVDLSAAPPLTSTLRLERNRFSFEDLEAVAARPGTTYTPQDSVDVKQSALKELNETQTWAATLGGTANAYQWKKNNTNLAGATNPTLSIPNLTLADDGTTYSYEATNSLVPGLTLISRPKLLKISSLRRDSIALRALYSAAGGPNWTNRSNWTTTSLRTGNWFGVTINNNRVTAVNLPNNNLVGAVPTDFGDLRSATNINLSGNRLTRLGTLTNLTSVTTLNLSNNRLGFGSLLSNVGIPGINYSGQANIDADLQARPEVGTDFKVKAITDGTGNQYVWRRNGTTVPNATDSTYTITGINRSNMGAYVAEITNPGVPNLILRTGTKNVLAVANITGTVQSTPTAPMNNGVMRLFKVTTVGAYDTIRVQNSIAPDGRYAFNAVVLDDYTVLAAPNTTAFPNDLPTYYTNKLFWEEADKIVLTASRNDINITMAKKPTTAPTGQGVIGGFFEEPVGGGKEDEVTRNRRVANASVSVRRRVGTGRTTNERLELVAQLTTNQNGEFEFTSLPEGEYLLNLQYPGFPMDERSFINIQIGRGLNRRVSVEALVQADKIVVNKRVVTGWEEDTENLFTVYPNPTQAMIHVEINNTTTAAEGALQFVILNAQGQRLREGTLPSDGLRNYDLTELATGVYLMQISQHGKLLSTQRLVVME